jgi:hypothetical protein
MEALTMCKIRVVVLWLLAIVALFGYRTFALNEVPSVQSNISLVTDQEVAVVSIVLMVFAVLSLVLKGSTNRRTNIIAGAVVGLGTLIVLVDGVTVNLYGVYNLWMGAIVIFMVLVVLFAYKMPKQRA